MLTIIIGEAMSCVDFGEMVNTGRNVSYIYLSSLVHDIIIIHIVPCIVYREYAFWETDAFVFVFVFVCLFVFCAYFFFRFVKALY